MSIASIASFVTWIAALVGIAALVLLGSVAVAAVEFFTEHRATRVARHEPVRAYYRHLALGH